MPRSARLSQADRATPEVDGLTDWVDKSSISADQLEWYQVRALRETESQLLVPSSATKNIKIQHPEKGPLVNLPVGLGRVTQQCSRTSDCPDNHRCMKGHKRGYNNDSDSEWYNNQGQRGVCLKTCDNGQGDCTNSTTCTNSGDGPVCMQRCVADYGGSEYLNDRGGHVFACKHPQNPFCKDYRVGQDFGYCVSNTDIARHGRTATMESMKRTPKSPTGTQFPDFGRRGDEYGTISLECPIGHVATGLHVKRRPKYYRDRKGRQKEQAQYYGFHALRCQRVEEAADPKGSQKTVRFVSHAGQRATKPPVNMWLGTDYNGQQSEDTLVCPQGYALTALLNDVKAEIPENPHVLCRKLLDPDSAQRILPQETDTQKIGGGEWTGAGPGQHYGYWATGVTLSWEEEVYGIGLNVSRKAKTDRTIDKIVEDDVTLLHTHPACDNSNPDTLVKLGKDKCNERALKRCCGNRDTTTCPAASDTPEYTIVSSRGGCTHDGIDNVIKAVRGSGAFDLAKQECSSNPECAGFACASNNTECTLLRHVAGGNEWTDTEWDPKPGNKGICVRRNTKATDTFCKCLRSDHFTRDMEINLPLQCDPECGSNPNAYKPKDETCKLNNVCISNLEVNAGKGVNMEDIAACNAGELVGDRGGVDGGSGDRVIAGVSERKQDPAGLGGFDEPLAAGAVASEATAADDEDDDPEKDEDTDDDTVIILIGVIAAVMLIIAIGYVYFNSNDNAAAASETTTETNTEAFG